MKKIVFFLIIGCVMAASAFAQSYTVQSVTGRVEQEAGGKRVEVKAGDTLSADTVIHTGVGSSLVLKSGERTFTVPAVRNGKVAELSTAASSVRISGNVSRINTGEVDRTTGQVSTASARASEAAEDEDIAAE